jgi:transcriptional regulator with XRE-family HTH domain
MLRGTPPSVQVSVAEALRSARSRLGYTLEQLAEHSGLSKAYLSRLEAGERQPSIASLLALGRALHVPMSRLLGEAGDTTPLLIAGGEQDSQVVNHLRITPLSGFTGSRALEAVKIGIDADRSPPPLARHRGEEWLYVLEGTLTLEYGAETHVLVAGQSAHFDADYPHRLGTPGPRAEVLLIAADVVNDLRRAH